MVTRWRYSRNNDFHQHNNHNRLYQHDNDNYDNNHKCNDNHKFRNRNNDDKFECYKHNYELRGNYNLDKYDKYDKHCVHNNDDSDDHNYELDKCEHDDRHRDDKCGADHGFNNNIVSGGHNNHDKFECYEHANRHNHNYDRYCY